MHFCRKAFPFSWQEAISAWSLGRFRFASSLALSNSAAAIAE